MKVQRGDVVLLDHPFTDASGSKVRPALVVQADHRNAILTNTVVPAISKNVSRVHVDPTQILVDIATPDGKLTGLIITSAVNLRQLVHGSRRPDSKEDRHHAWSLDAQG